jgi:predicted porin
MASGYYGKGLGMTSVQDGDFLGSTSTDVLGKERTHWGYLAQATYALTPAVTVGVNYGQSRQNESDADKNKITVNEETFSSPVKTQAAATVSLTYAFNSFTKFTGEYTNAKNTWMDGATQKSNQFALGSTFFW